MNAVFDHFVILARTLDEGVAWAGTTLGIEPTAGGNHPNMATHNRIFAVSSSPFPGTYCEILAIDPAAAAPGRARWFDADDPMLAAAGPRLVGYAARTTDLAAARGALLAEGLDPGPVLSASRQTPRGLLEWHITVRDDGHRLLGGTVPTLIQWGAVHPGDSLPACGVELTAVQLSHPEPALVRLALADLGLDLPVVTGPPSISVRLVTPRGPLSLTSHQGN